MVVYSQIRSEACERKEPIHGEENGAHAPRKNWIFLLKQYVFWIFILIFTSVSYHRRSFRKFSNLPQKMNFPTKIDEVSHRYRSSGKMYMLTFVVRTCSQVLTSKSYHEENLWPAPLPSQRSLLRDNLFAKTESCLYQRSPQF